MHHPREFAVAILLLASLVLMPFGRAIELPLGVLALAGCIALFRGVRNSSSIPWILLAASYVAFVLPMLVALPDAVKFDKTLMSTIGSLRYALMSVAVLWVLQEAERGRDMQSRLLDAFGMATTIVLLLWCCDAILQFYSGENVLGYGVGEGYVNGLFGEDDNIKLGVTVAVLAPISLVFVVRRWGMPATAALLMLFIFVVLLSGKRAAWIILFVELLGMAAYYLSRGKLFWGRFVAISLLSTLVLGVSYSSSDWFRARSDVLLSALDSRDYESLNRATGKRLPIWNTAARMAVDNPLNGVGPRGFRYAYQDYANADDHWADVARYTGGSRATHAHQIILDIGSETGLVGLTGYGALLLILWWGWRRADADARARALPFALALLGTMFPINTHQAWYSSAAALQLWLLIALYFFALASLAFEAGDSQSST